METNLYLVNFWCRDLTGGMIQALVVEATSDSSAINLCRNHHDGCEDKELQFDEYTAAKIIKTGKEQILSI